MQDKKVCLVVGGNGGIGSSIIKVFIERDYIVYYTYNKKLSENSMLDYENVFACKIDVTNECDIKDLSLRIAKEQGRIDVLIYAAGVFLDSLVPEMPLENWNYVLDVNVTGAFLCAKYFISLLRKSNSGRFIAIGSVMGESGCYGSASYAASKAALIGFIKSLALENAKYGITANIVSHGYINTGMTNDVSDVVLESAMKRIPMKRFGDPMDAAKIVADLCEEHANYISGQVIRNNGLLYV